VVEVQEVGDAIVKLAQESNLAPPSLAINHHQKRSGRLWVVGCGMNSAGARRVCSAVRGRV
jgi:hypothetical protein